MDKIEASRDSEAHAALRKKRISYAMILGAATCWGVMGLWNRELLSGGFSSFTIVAVRNFGGLFFLTLFFLLTDRSVFKIKKEHLKYFFCTGILSVMLFTLCYFTCQKYCSLAMAAVLSYAAPAMVVILAFILWKEPVTKKKAMALGFTLLGCVFVTNVFTAGASVSAIGILLGLGAAFFYALYSIFGRYALAHYGPMTVTYWTFVFCGLGSLFFLQPADLSYAVSQPNMWVLGICLAVISTATPYILYTNGLARIETGKAAIMASFEPVVSATVGVLIFAEAMTLFTGLGILCVLIGVYILR